MIKRRLSLDVMRAVEAGEKEQMRKPSMTKIWQNNLRRQTLGLLSHHPTLLPSLKDQKGVTLIELLVVCVILAIAFIGLLGLFPLGSRNISESRLRTIAVQLAQEKMESLLNQSEDSADLVAGTHNDPSNPIRSSFNRYWQVQDNIPVSGMKRVEVWVTYPHGSEVREVRLISQRRG